MTNPRKPITILLAEDATHDQNLIRQVVQESHPLWRLDIVKDGEELLDYLHHRRQYSQWGSAPRPNLILLDWHLAKLNSSEVLQAIKADPNCGSASRLLC